MLLAQPYAATRPTPPPNDEGKGKGTGKGNDNSKGAGKGKLRPDAFLTNAELLERRAERQRRRLIYQWRLAEVRCLTAGVVCKTLT